MSIFIAPSIVLSADSSSLRWPAFLWTSLITAAGISADHADSNYPATNLANPATASLWKSGSTADQDIVFTVSPSAPIDSVGIARHNWGSGAVGVTILGKTADVGAVFETLLELSPGDDSPILAIFESGYYTQIKISLAPGSVAPQAAVISIGTLLRMTTGIPPGHMPLFDARDITLLTAQAENGDFLGDVITSQLLSTSVDFKLLDPDWYRTNMRAFMRSRDPFFFAWSPTSYPLECSYCKFNGSPKPTINQVSGQMDISLPLIGLAL